MPLRAIAYALLLSVLCGGAANSAQSTFEVMAVRPELLKDEQAKRVMAHHTSPQEAGTVFTRAHPKLAVYTHIVLRGAPGIPVITPEEIVAQTRETYKGPLEVGEDLFSVDISEDGKLTVRKPGQKN